MDREVQNDKKIFFHIDVNSAFLSWSAVKRLKEGVSVDLRTIPSVIGGDSSTRHGIVLAKSIPAKVFGISTGEPLAAAVRKCPSLVIEPPDHHYYSEQSRLLMAYLGNICPEIEQVSVDECYMDYTPVAANYESPEAAADMIRTQVRERFGYTVNVGISDRKVLAKMASDFEKPDKVHTLFLREIPTKMWPLPISDLFMCGKSSVHALQNLGIRTIGDLANADPNVIALNLKSHGRLLYDFANGRDSSPVETVHPDRKGVGNSTTLPRDLTNAEDAYPVLLSLAEIVAARLRRAGKLCSSVNVEIRSNTFVTTSHQMLLPAPTDLADEIYLYARKLFDALWNHDPIRLLGIRTTRLTNSGEPEQLDLFSLGLRQETEPESNGTDPVTAPVVSREQSEKLRKLAAAMDSIRSRYGDNAIRRASDRHFSGHAEEDT